VTKSDGTFLKGFHRLRAGKIHLQCPKCRRKMSNIDRCDHDPDTAVLVQIFCERCGAGGKDAESYYFDAQGRELDYMTGTPI
jgi:hypothetical protein